MASIKDLTDFGKQLTPVVTDLIDTWQQEGQPVDTREQAALVAKLQGLVSGWPLAPDASLEDRAGAIGAMRKGLTDLLLKAATSNVALDENQVLTMQAQRDSLRSAFGRLLELSALTPIAGLLTEADLNGFKTNLDSARQGIKGRMAAKAILNTVIDVAIIAGQVAVKLAA